MSLFKNKLDNNLKIALDNKYYKTYRVLIQYRNLQQNIESKIKSYKGEHIHSIPSIKCICAKLSGHAIERILEYPEIDYICFDSYATICGTTAGFSVLSSNGIAFQERYKLTGKGIGIGIVDTGVYPHPDLVGSNNRIKYFLDIIGGLRYPYDDNGHGTFMSGIIGGNGSQSKGMYRGVAENSHIISVKAFNGLGKGLISDILYGIENLINESETYRIKIICLPFELADNNYNIINLFSNIFDYALSKSIVVVVPSGSNGNDDCSIRGIATLPNCITVGGLDTQNSIKSYKYSSAGPLGKIEKPDLSAASVNICSLNTNKDYISERNGQKIYTQSLDIPYTSYTGTSCAAAYISGVIALLLENNSNLLFKDISSLLKVSSTMLSMSKWIQGAGMVDLSKLLP